MNTRLGAYRIVGKIGEGAIGVVYEGLHETLKRRVAIKVLRSDRSSDPQVVQRFLNEARAANAIQHESIVNVYDYGESDDGPYIVMELLQGETLGEHLKRMGGRLPTNQIVHIFGPVLRALAAAHAHGVVHRDLKPPNVFLAGNTVKLLDFGVAKLSQDWGGGVQTRAGMAVGTPFYMSPEQIGGRAVDGRSDLFAVGIMLYEVVVGDVPFKAKSMPELAARVMRVEPRLPSTRVPNVPPALEAVIMRALQKQPEQRFPDAHAMLKALEAALPDMSLPETLRGQIDAPRVTRRQQPHSRASLWLALGVLAAAVIAGVALAAMHHTGPAPVPPAAPAGPKPEELLRDALAAPDLGEAGDAVAALDLAATPRSAALLYPVLGSAPELRRQAAHVLERLKLPEAAPKIRAMLDRSGDRLRVELAAVLATLGDKDVGEILRHGLEDPTSRLRAAVGLAALGEPDVARPVLLEFFDATPHGRGEWRLAAETLLAIGEDRARQSLVAELSEPDNERAVAAAAVLMRHGIGDGMSYLQRVVAQRDFDHRGAAALALAREGDKAALVFVADGLKSAAPEARRHAAAVAGVMGDAGFRAELEKVMRADPDRRVRLSAAAALVGF